ncbi:MAG: OmpA family protein [Bacteroidia bacterium]|nr:OmpA family protein [Bacteroidia bacterium]MDW8346319.1 OmpA family protein [Bacteroidia bacterium]
MYKKGIITSLTILTAYLCLAQSIIQPEPEWKVITFAGGLMGYKDGKGTEARFNKPNGMCIDIYDNIYVSDDGNDCIRKITPDGQVTTFVKGIHGCPVADKKGNIYVANDLGHAVYKISSNGKISLFAGGGRPGYRDGVGKNALFNRPASIDIDANDNIIIAEMEGNRIRRISPDGTVTTIAGSGQAGYANGKGKEASFDYPLGICMDVDDNAIIVDSKNKAIRKITPDGVVTTVLNSKFKGFTDKTNGISSLSFETGRSNNIRYYGNWTDIYNTPSNDSWGGDVVLDKSHNNMYIADGGNNCILRVNFIEKTVTVFAGNGRPGNKDGPLSVATFNNPVEIVVDSKGNFFVVDHNNNSIRKIERSFPEIPKKRSDSASVVITPVKPTLRETRLIGKVIDVETKQPIETKVDIIAMDTKLKISCKSTQEGFKQTLKNHGEYELIVEAQGYLPYENKLEVKEGTDNQTVIELHKIKKGEKVVLNNIYFEPNKYTLDPRSYDELERVYNFLKAYPTVRIRIEGHTDGGVKGTDPAYLQKLSQDRANEVMNWLIKKGIDRKRLEAVGYGSSKPIADNNTEEGRKKNRRTEFEVITE